MKSIRRRFCATQQKNPDWSSLTCFAEAILKQKFKMQTISRHFHKLVKKNDFSRSDKKQILEHLFSLSKCLHDNEK